MTATAAMMVAFGVEDGKKSVWSWILGIGLAIQAAPIFNAAFGGLSGMDMNVHPVIPADVTSFHFTVTNGSSAANKANPDYWNVTGNFMNYYIKGIIYPAAARIVPYACRICLVLTCIDVSVQLGLKLVEGDKVKFMVSKFLTCGIYLFLITNWVGYGNDMGGMRLMGRLSDGMRALGNVAMGTDQTQLGTNNIFGDCVAIASAYFNTIDKAGIVMKIFLGFVGIIVCVMLLLIAFEMIMAMFEFWTMALLTLPLLAFGTIPQLKFLSESAIKAMFNLGIKVMCIAFLTGVVTTTLDDYTKSIISAAESNWSAANMTSNKWGFISGFGEDVSNSLSLLVVVGMLWMLVRKMPQLIQGLLQGNPSLSAGDMMGTLTGAMNSAGGGIGRVSAAMGGGSDGDGEAGSGGGGGGDGGSSGGSGGAGGSAAASPKGKMQALKDAATTVAAATVTGGAGAAAKVGGKMLAGAMKKGAVAAIKGVANVGKATLKAGGRAALRNTPGFKGYWDGKKQYKTNKDETTLDSTLRKREAAQQAQQAQTQKEQHHDELNDKGVMMGNMVRSVGGEDAYNNFQQNFKNDFGFEPKPKPPKEDE